VVSDRRKRVTERAGGGRPLAGLIAGLRQAARVVVARWRAGLDRALRYMGGVRA